MTNLSFIIILALILINVVSAQYFFKKIEKKNDLLFSMRAKGMEPDPNIAAGAREVEVPPLDDDMSDDEEEKTIDPSDMTDEDFEQLGKKGVI